MGVWDDTAESYSDGYRRSGGRMQTEWLEFKDCYDEFSFKRGMARIDDWYANGGISGGTGDGRSSCSYTGNRELCLEIYRLYKIFWKRSRIVELQAMQNQHKSYRSGGVK